MGNCTSHQQQHSANTANNDNNTTYQQENRLPQNSHYARYPPANNGSTLPPSSSYFGRRPERPPPIVNIGPERLRIPPWQQQRERQQQQQENNRPQSLTQTATIRNAVNLQKSSLKVVPSQVDPRVLMIEFNFDASEPCCVMTFAGVQENGSKSSEFVQVPGVFKDDGPVRPFAPCVEYSAGMRQRFPKTDMPLVVATCHSIDLNLLDETKFVELAQLSKEEHGSYSLVIRLATISEHGRKQGYTLQDIVPGEPLKPWIQSQTTFASITKEGDAWNVHVVKQKLWVDGVSYVLQEIYGLENASTSGTNGTDTNEEQLCVICLSNRKDTTALPCRHMCMCHECADALRKQSSMCPICRNKVESLLRIKLNDRNGSG